MQGFQVQAFVVSQPWSAHAEQVLRSSVAAGVDLVPIRKNLRAVMRHARRLDWTSYIIPPGGSNLCGSVGYFEAAIELAQQIQWGELPEPDYIVVALGSGGTAAGLLAGLEFAGLKSRVVGVAVLGARGCGLYARQLSNAILRSVGSASSVSPDRLIVNKSVLGEGYGHESEPGKAARSKANSLDLPLDPTYTAKAFAGALSLAKGKQTGAVGNAWESNLPLRPSTVLYWHTLSVLPLANRDSATVSTLSRELQDLLRHCPKTDSSN
jgi:D-cysteine desulfhydrase